jgi:hypothetical protein
MRVVRPVRLLVLGAILLATGLALRYVRVRTDPTALRAALVDALRAAVAGDISVTEVRLDTSGNLHASGLVISAEGAQTPLFECETAEAELGLMSLLKGARTPSRVSLCRPKVWLHFDSETRRWNFASLRGARSRPARPTPRSVPEAIIVEDGTLSLRKAAVFGDDAPRLYEGLWLRAWPATGDGTRWNFEGRLGRGPLAGTHVRGEVDVQGTYLARVECSLASVDVSEDLWDCIPHGGTVWRDYEPQGLFSADGVLSVRANGSLTYSFRIAARDASARTRFAPFRISSVAGTVLVSDRGVRVCDVAGLIASDDVGASGTGPQPTGVSVDATVPWNGGEHYEIHLRGVPLCRRTVECIPDAGARVWDRLRPEGEADVSLVIDSPRPGSRPTWRARATVRGGVLRPGELPRPLRCVNGTLTVTPTEVVLESATARVEQTRADGTALPPARIDATGRLSLGASAMDLLVAFESLRTDEELVTALPGHGATVWREVRPELLLSGRVHLRQSPGDAVPAHEVHLCAEGGDVRLSFWPVPLTDVTGSVTIRGTQVTLEDVAARVASGTAHDREAAGAANHVEAVGSVDIAGPLATVWVRGANMALREALVRSIPVVGGLLWEEGHPEGAASVSGVLSYDGRRPQPLTCVLSVDLDDVSVSSPSVPFPLRELSARLFVTEQRATCSNFTGISCDGEVRGAAVAYYGTDSDYPTYGATVAFRQVDLACAVRRLTGPPAEATGMLRGAVDVGGVLDGSGMHIQGNLQVSDGRLWKTPVFAGLLNILRFSLPPREEQLQRGRAEFARVGGRTRIDAFEFVGGGLILTGSGTASDDGSLDLAMTVVGGPTKGPRIPLLSSVVGWLMRGVEREFFRVDVTGTFEKPRFTLRPLAHIVSPMAGMRAALAGDDAAQNVGER